MGLDARNPDFVTYEQQKRRPACAPAQFDQRLCYSLYVHSCERNFPYNLRTLQVLLKMPEGVHVMRFGGNSQINYSLNLERIYTFIGFEFELCHFLAQLLPKHIDIGYIVNATHSTRVRLSVCPFVRLTVNQNMSTL